MHLAPWRLWPGRIKVEVVERLIFRLSTKRNPRGQRPRLQQRPDLCPSYGIFSGSARTSALDAPVNHRIGSRDVHYESGCIGHRLSEHLLRLRSENFACEMFSFRMPSAKPLKTFLFLRRRNIRFRGFQCYQCLAGRFCFAFFLGDVLRSLGGGRSRFLFTEDFTLPWISAFWKTKFQSYHRAARTSAEAARKSYEFERLPPPLVMHSPGLTRGPSKPSKTPLYGAQDSRSSPVRLAIRDFVDHYGQDVARIWGAGH